MCDRVVYALDFPCSLQESLRLDQGAKNIKKGTERD